MKRSILFLIGIVVMTALACGLGATSGDVGQLPPPVAATQPADGESGPEVEVTAVVVVPTSEAADGPDESDPAALVDAELARLEQSRLLYNPPSEMRVGDVSVVEARITHDLELSPEAFAEGLQGAGEPAIETIEINRFVSVRLVGDSEAFNITELSSAEQTIAGPFTEWAWEVTPLEAGEQELLLVVTARIKIPGSPDERKDLHRIERPIAVQVNPMLAAQSFVGDNLEWIITVLIVPVSLWFYRRVRLPGGKEGG